MTDDNSSSPAHRPSAHHDGAAQQPGSSHEQLHPRTLGLADPSEARGVTTDDLTALVASLAPNLDAAQLRQLQRELQGWASAYDRLMLAWHRDIERGDPLRHSPIRRLMDSFVHPLANDLAERAEAAKTSRGRKPSWLHLALDPLGPHGLATIAVSAILSEVLEHGLKPSRRLRNRSFTDTQLATRIGHEVSHAARLAAWKRKHPALFRAFTDRLDKAGATDRHRRTVMAHGLGKLHQYVLEGDDNDAGDEGEAGTAVADGTERWPEVEQRRVGFVLVYAAMRAAPALISSELVRARKAHYRMHINPELLEWAQEAMHRKALASTTRRPMLCPPLPWNGPTGGGYLLGIGSNKHLVSGGERPSRKAQRDALKSDPPKLVLAAINAVQSVPWEINPHVLSIAREAADNGIALSSLPQSFIEPLPPQPLDFETSSEAQKKWRREAAVVHNLNARRTRKAVAALATVNEATELSQGEPAFWFPAHVDTRGRLYAYGTGLNPHGNDLSRSLLRFHDGKPIGSGSDALAAHVAGAFGRDKLSWDARIRWTEENEALLRRIAGDPLGNRAEWEAEADGDGIWSALAAAREWTDYLDSGRSPAFVTKLPCYIDGTCNGLQHFAALARDETLGQSVNLLPSSSKAGLLAQGKPLLHHSSSLDPGPSDSRAPPRDIYQTVADKLLDLVHEARDSGPLEDRRAANLWLRLFKGNRPPRSIAKRAVMTKPYGATMNVLLDEIGEFWEDANGPEEWRDVLLQDDEGETEVRKLRGWLAKKLKAALGDTTRSADEIMKWLKASTRLMLEHRVEIDPPWRTPSGWPWLSKYQSIDEKTHVLKQPGERPREFSTYTESLTKPDKRGQAASVAPNFVQGLDASALMLAVSKMTSAGVIAVTTVHDSVGCLTPDMPVVARAVREGFVETHDADPLASYREAVLAALPNDKARAKLPPLPKQGSLNIRG